MTGAAGPRRPRRRESTRLLAGRGEFLADLDLGPVLEAAFVRSPHAHARVVAIDTARARGADGVRAVFVAADLGAALGPIPPKSSPAGLRAVERLALARDEVRYVGEPVVMVVADDRRHAEEAALLVAVAYAPLPAVASIAAASAVGAPLAHLGLESNVALHQRQRAGDPDRVLAGAPRILRERFVVRRGGGYSLECRAVAARFDAVTGQLTVWDATQAPHHVRTQLATLLGLDELDVRVVAPRDIGGGFGPKAQFYGEELAVAWAARAFSATVRWVEDRRENLLSATCERTQVHEVTAGFDTRGTLLALRDEISHDLGAYGVGAQVPVITLTTLPGPYRIGNLDLALTSYFTNLPPTAPLRGSGRPQAVFVVERVLDRIAAECGLAPEEVRRANLVTSSEQPYSVGLIARDGKPISYDGGDYPALLDEALERVDVARFRASQSAGWAAGVYRGLGIACFVEGSGLGPFEGARARLTTEGRFVVAIGPSAQGQGHETVFGDLAALVLGCDRDDVEIRRGDTAAVDAGHGAFASRVTATAGPALVRACEGLRDDCRRAAALLLGVPEEAVVLADGEYRTSGGASVTLADLARVFVVGQHGTFLPTGAPVRLDHRTYFTPERACYTSGVLAVVAEVDPELGVVRVERAVLGHDCGVVLDPGLVEGQLVGGFAHGLGNALFEELRYAEDGAPRTTSSLDYLVPTALDVARPETFHRCTPSPVNPLGVRGAGESGVIPVPAAVANAVEDALAPFGARVTETPLTPERVRAAVLAGNPRWRGAGS